MEADWTTLARTLGFSGELSGNLTSIPTELGSFLQAHLEKYVELQRTHSDSILRVAQAEQQSRHLDEQVATKEVRILTLTTELESLTAIHEKVSGDLKQLQTERGQLFGALEEARLNEERHKNRLMSIESEKTELVRANDRKVAEKASLEADHERLLALLAKMRHDSSELEERLLEAQRERSKLSFELSRAQGEIEQLKEKSAWGESELDRVFNDIAEYRKQKSQEISDLNAVVSEKTFELDQMTNRANQLFKANDGAKKTLQDLSEELSVLKSEMSRAKADFEAEMESKTRLAELYKASSEEADQHVKELEASLENAVNRVTELESVAQQDHELEPKKRHVADVFAENSQTRMELSRLKQENEKLKECLEEVCGEIEARAPLLNQERKENERLKRELLALTTHVVELGKARDELASAQSQSWLEVERLRRDNHSLAAQSQDLSKQVRQLVQRLEQGDSEESPSAFADTIDEDAVVFRSIGDLQARNADLIRRVHELEYMLAQNQNNNVDKHQLEMAMKEIEELNQARNRQSAMLESLFKQQPNSSLSHRLSSSSLLESSVSKEVESLKADKLRIEQTLRDQIQTLLSAEGDLRAKLSMAQSQAQYANESLEMMKRSLEAERSELSQLRIRCRELADINMKLNGQVQSASADSMAAKEREHQATISCNRALSELQSLKASEERANKDLVDLRAERDRYVRLISQLQAAVSDNETSYKELRERLGQQIELLEKELASVRQRLSAELEDTRNSYLTVERERRELMSKQEQLLDQLTVAKSELIRLQAEGGPAVAIMSSAGNTVEHYKASAKASEQALSELGKAFEEYRMRVESEGFSQSEHLAKELESTRAQLTEHQSRYQVEVAEYKSRLAILEQLEQQLREHGNMRLEDLANLQNDLVRAKEELAMERQQSSSAQADLAKLTEAIEEHVREESALKDKIAELECHCANFEVERTNLVQDQINIQQRFDELSKQYDALLEKLEGSLKPSYLFPSSISSEDDQIQQVIRYLRREKDALEKEKSALETENRRLNHLYDQVSTSYNQLKRSLTSTSDGSADASQRVSHELSELRQRLEQLSGYRETAAVLQSQVDSLTDRLTQTEADLQAAIAKLNPLKENNRELKATVTSHQHEVKMLTDDRDLWKRRCQDASGGVFSEISPEQVQQLRSDLESVQQEKEQLTIEANQKLANLEARYAKAVERFNFYKKRSEELQAKINELDAVIQQQQQQQQQQQNVLDRKQDEQQPNEQLADIANDLEETRGLLNEALAQKDELQAKLEQSEQKVNRLTTLAQKQKNLRREYDTLKTDCELGMREAKEEVARLEAKFADLTKEQSLHQTVLISQWKSRFEKLQVLLEEYKSRFGDMQLASAGQPLVTTPPAIAPAQPVQQLKEQPAKRELSEDEQAPAKSSRVDELGEESAGSSYHDDHDDYDSASEDNGDDDGDEEEDEDGDDESDTEDNQDEYDHQQSYSDDAMMTDDDLVAVFPSTSAPSVPPTTTTTTTTQPPKVDLLANMKALSPNEDVKPRPRFVNLSGIRSSSATATPLTPLHSQPSQAPSGPSKKADASSKKRGSRNRGPRRRQ